MAKVTILRGVPGSGKSTLAKSLDGAIVSADNYMTDGDGNYKFDPSNLIYAHGECLSEYMRHLLEWGTAHVIVDNTNITAVECAPYVAIAQAVGADVEIVTIAGGLNIYETAARNVHGVPLVKVNQMFIAMIEESKRFPRWWRSRAIAAYA